MWGSEAGKRRKRIACINEKVPAVGSWGLIPGDFWLILQNKDEEIEIFTHQLPSVISCRLLATLQQACPWTKQGPVTRASNAYNGKTINTQILKTSAGWQA